MAQGRAVVATGSGGSSESLRDGETCLLFAPGDAEALAAAIRRLATDPARRVRLREAGLKTAPRHTEASLNEAVEQALMSAAESGASSRAPQVPVRRGTPRPSEHWSAADRAASRRDLD